MHLYCPTCKATFPATERCPRCAGRLVTPAEAFTSHADPGPPPPATVRPTAAGRVVVGCVVTLGVYLGLRDWLLAGVAAANLGDGGKAVTDAALIALRLVGVAAGGLIGGAGRHFGGVSGLVVGLVCGCLFLAVDSAADGGSPPGPLGTGVATAAALLALGSGSLGGRVWPPAVDLPAPVVESRGSSLLRLAQESEEKKAGRPTVWWRVAVGAAVAVAGVAWADAGRETLRQVAAGSMNLSRAPMVDLELAAMLVLVGGATAGASTAAGVRHGALAGLAAAVAVAGLTAVGREGALLVADGLFRVIGWPAADLGTPRGLLVVFACVLAAVTAGGWLGGTLLPPVRVNTTRVRFGSGA